MKVNGLINIDDYVLQEVKNMKADGLEMSDMEDLFRWASTIDKTLLLSYDQWDEKLDHFLGLD